MTDVFLLVWSILSLITGVVIVAMSFTVPQPTLVYTFFLAFGGGILIGRSIKELKND